MHKKTDIFQFFHFKKIFGISPSIQIGILIGLYMLHSYLSYLYYGDTHQVDMSSVDRIGVLVPVYEEMIFRGIIFALLLRSFSPQKAILISAFLFGFYHFQNIVGWGLKTEVFIQMFYTFLLGLFLGWITYKTRTIWPAVMVHYVNNIITISSLLIVLEKVTETV